MRAAVINNAAINPGLSPAGMTAFGKKRRESSPPPHLYPPASFNPATPFVSLCLLYLSFSFDERTRRLALSRGCSRERKMKGWRMKRVDGVEESRPDVYRGAYISRERKRGSGDPLSLSISCLLSFSFSPSVLSISNHFFQPSPPCDLPLPSLVHPLLLLREAMLRYDLFRRDVPISRTRGFQEELLGYRK